MGKLPSGCSELCWVPGSQSELIHELNGLLGLISLSWFQPSTNHHLCFPPTMATNRIGSLFSNHWIGGSEFWDNLIMPTLDTLPNKEMFLFGQSHYVSLVYIHVFSQTAYMFKAAKLFIQSLSTVYITFISIMHLIIRCRSRFIYVHIYIYIYIYVRILAPALL